MEYKVIDGKGIIPDGTTEIEKSAFKGCTSLQSIEIPDSVTEIGDEAFGDCPNLQSIEIPDSVTRINHSAFSGCNNLTSITVSKNNPKYKSINNCILTKDGKILILCRNHNIPDSVTIIGDFAFKGYTSLQSIEIPDSVTTIGWAAFWDCAGLQSIVIPDSVTMIDRSAFWGCNNLTSIIVSKNNPKYESTDNCILTKGGKELVLCRSHNIPDGVTTIGSAAFDGCTSFQSIVIPDSVTSIDRDAFSSCSGLQSITITTQEKEPDMSRERIEYLLQALSEYSKEFFLRVPIGCGYAYRHHPAFEGKFQKVIGDIDA